MEFRTVAILGNPGQGAELRAGSGCFPLPLSATSATMRLRVDTRAQTPSRSKKPHWWSRIAMTLKTTEPATLRAR